MIFKSDAILKGKYKKEVIIETSKLCTSYASEKIQYHLGKNAILSNPKLYLEHISNLENDLPNKKELQVVTSSLFKSKTYHLNDGILLFSINKKSSFDILKKISKNKRKYITEKFHDHIIGLSIELFNIYLKGLDLLTENQNKIATPEFNAFYYDSLPFLVNNIIKNMNHYFLLKSELRLNSKNKDSDGILMVIIKIDPYKQLVSLIKNQQNDIKC